MKETSKNGFCVSPSCKNKNIGLFKFLSAAKECAYDTYGIKNIDYYIFDLDNGKIVFDTIKSQMNELKFSKEDLIKVSDEVETEETIDVLKEEMYQLLKTNEKFMKLFRKTKKEIAKKFNEDFKADLAFRKKHECKICGCHPCMGDC